MWIIVNYENKMYYFRYSSCFVEKQDFLGERHCPEDQWYNASKGSVLQAAATDTGSRFYVIKESEKNSTVLTVNYEFKNSCNILWVWMGRVINMYFEGLLNIFLFVNWFSVPFLNKLTQNYERKDICYRSIFWAWMLCVESIFLLHESYEWL